MVNLQLTRETLYLDIFHYIWLMMWLWWTSVGLGSCCLIASAFSWQGSGYLIFLICCTEESRMWAERKQNCWYHFWKNFCQLWTGSWNVLLAGVEADHRLWQNVETVEYFTWICKWSYGKKMWTKIGESRYKIVPFQQKPVVLQVEIKLYRKRS